MMEDIIKTILVGALTAITIVAVLYALYCIVEWWEKRTKSGMRIIKKGKLPKEKVECPCCHSIIEYTKVRKMTREKEISKAALEYANEEIVAAPYDAFMAGAQWADSHPHWISVEDELPPKQPNREQSKNVLVRTNSGRIKIEYYDYGNDVIKEWWEYNITHWMPLPQAPKKGGEA